LVYAVVELANQNLNNIFSRSIFQEIKEVGRQMVMSWSIYTVILFLQKEAHHFSRTLYVITFFACFICILVVRTIWKIVVKFSKRSLSPKLLVICEAEKAQTVLERILPGQFENQYTISAVITNENGETHYLDWYPILRGFHHIKDFLNDKRVQAAYVELHNAEEEERVIKELLNAGILIHRSLGDSSFHYASQNIEDLAYHSVIKIADTQISLVSQADKMFKEKKRLFSEKKNRD
jgi:FlaA1/EpsC-like NDP-sugar epimerase